MNELHKFYSFCMYDMICKLYVVVDSRAYDTYLVVRRGLKPIFFIFTLIFEHFFLFLKTFFHFLTKLLKTLDLDLGLGSSSDKIHQSVNVHVHYSLAAIYICSDVTSIAI